MDKNPGNDEQPMTEGDPARKEDPDVILMENPTEEDADVTKKRQRSAVIVRERKGNISKTCSENVQSDRRDMSEENIKRTKEIKTLSENSIKIDVRNTKTLHKDNVKRIEKISNIAEVDKLEKRLVDIETKIYTSRGDRSGKNKIDIKTMIESLRKDIINKVNKENAKTLESKYNDSSKNLSNLSMTDLNDIVMTSTPKNNTILKESPSIITRKNFDKNNKKTKDGSREDRNLDRKKLDDNNLENKFRVRDMKELTIQGNGNKVKSKFIERFDTQNSLNDKDNSSENKELEENSYRLSQDSIIEELEQRRNSNASLVIDNSDDTIIISSEDENKKEIEKRLTEINNLRSMREQTLNKILKMNNQTIDSEGREEINKFTAKIKEILDKSYKDLKSGENSDKKPKKEKISEIIDTTAKNNLNQSNFKSSNSKIINKECKSKENNFLPNDKFREMNCNQPSVRIDKNNVETVKSTRENNYTMKTNIETIERNIYEQTRGRASAEYMEISRQGQNQHGDITCSRDLSRSKLSEENKQSTAEMEFKNQLEALSEEENNLLRRIEKRIRMQSVIKKRQERLNILRRLAGDTDDETTPSETEIDELTKIEQKRTAEVSKKIFLALQAENIERTFHQVAKLEDNDGIPVYDVDIVVSVKKLSQSTGVNKAINIDMTIEGNLLEGDVRLVEPKDDTIPQTLGKVFERFKVRKDTSTSQPSAKCKT
ncbi:unnamed protein product [Lasius platythorax]|uniref:Uncharacterized protein n=1 Tax=Lasius platythorax TaxID=488582 RepID=A0AAV2MYX9_9HYME